MKLRLYSLRDNKPITDIDWPVGRPLPCKGDTLVQLDAQYEVVRTYHFAIPGREPLVVLEVGELTSAVDDFDVVQWYGWFFPDDPEMLTTEEPR